MQPIAYIMAFFLPILAIFIALIHIRWKHLAGWQAIGSVLMWQLAIGLGVSLIWAGFGHLLMPDQVATSIGWQTGSPFQREVGMWDLALGIVAVLCLIFRDHGFFSDHHRHPGYSLYVLGLAMSPSSLFSETHRHTTPGPSCTWTTSPCSSSQHS